ncbi:S8 family serine peptidase [Streptosporangiaceae bacterium NEAU-GS5]|nr:S8 family serine peptidase [Streptosporangiaceae bacterium NEAU-GS5]
MLKTFSLCFALALAALPAAPVQAAPKPDKAGQSDQWILTAIDVAEAWKTTKGAGVTVALLEGRVDGAVPELKGRVVSGPDLTGRIFGSDQPYGAATALASLIAGTGKKGGVQGVAPEAQVMSIAVSQPAVEGSFVDPQAEPDAPADSPLARGIRYAANHGAAVIVIPSWGYGVERLDRDAVAYALARGSVVIAGVGNDGGTPYSQESGTSFWQFPAGYPGVIGVAASDKQGAHAPFSSDNLSVLVAAPGVDLPVVQAGGKRAKGSGSEGSAALVAGVAALVKAKYPELKPEFVARALAETARPHPPAGYDDKVGFGVVDASAALTRAGQLGGYQRAIVGDDDLHFGHGMLSKGPEPPGPDPIRLWVYGAGVLIGIAAFSGAVVILAKRR